MYEPSAVPGGATRSTPSSPRPTAAYHGPRRLARRASRHHRTPGQVTSAAMTHAVTSHPIGPTTLYGSASRRTSPSSSAWAGYRRPTTRSSEPVTRASRSTSEPGSRYSIVRCWRSLAVTSASTSWPARASCSSRRLPMISRGTTIAVASTAAARHSGASHPTQRASGATVADVAGGAGTGGSVGGAAPTASGNGGPCLDSGRRTGRMMRSSHRATSRPPGIGRPRTSTGKAGPPIGSPPVVRASNVQTGRPPGGPSSG